MNKIEQGEFFELKTDKQKNAAEKVLKQTCRTKRIQKRTLCKNLKEFYDQKKDRRTFLVNLKRSSNHPVTMQGEKMVVESLKTEVKN